MSETANLFSPADAARVVEEGPWLGKRGVIQRVNSDRGYVVLFFDHFGRIIFCELEYASVEKLSPDDWDENLERIRALLFDENSGG